MSLDPRDLCFLDKVKFGGDVVKEVACNLTYPMDKEKNCICFRDGTNMLHTDSLWKIAELEAIILPIYLELFVLTEDGAVYRPDKYIYPIRPVELLRRMRVDVAALKAAGVKEDE